MTLDLGPMTLKFISMLESVTLHISAKFDQNRTIHIPVIGQNIGREEKKERKKEEEEKKPKKKKPGLNQYVAKVKLLQHNYSAVIFNESALVAINANANL